MSEDANSVASNDSEPVFPPRRAAPERIEPVTEDDLMMEDLLDDVDTISAEEQEERAAAADTAAAEPLTADDEPLGLAIDTPVDPVLAGPDTDLAVDPAIDPAIDPLVVPEEEPIAYTAMGEGETTVLTPLPPVDAPLYTQPLESNALTAATAGATAAALADADHAEVTEVNVVPADEVAEDIEKQAREDRGTMDLGLLILRVTLGVLMALHGADQLFGLFGGSIASTEQLLASIGFTNHTELMAIFAGVTELIGGIIVAIGLFTPVGASALLGVMGMAVLTHLALGDTAFFSVQNGPYELITLSAVMAATVILVGAGRWSVDGHWRWATRPKWGALVWFIIGLAAAPVMWAVLNTQGFPF